MSHRRAVNIRRDERLSHPRNRNGRLIFKKEHSENSEESLETKDTVKSCSNAIEDLGDDVEEPSKTVGQHVKDEKCERKLRCAEGLMEEA